jgi:hypothetical protein
MNTHESLQREQTDEIGRSVAMERVLTGTMTPCSLLVIITELLNTRKSLTQNRSRSGRARSCFILVDSI